MVVAKQTKGNMIPLSANPTVVIRLNPNTKKLMDVASNIAPDLKVVIVFSATAYDAESCNKPFDSLRPISVSR